jgi:uncharacterized protein (TIGR00730 family)
MPEKAYKNLDFLTSPAARTIRMVCEYEEPQRRFHQHGVKDTIVFFGSARAKQPAEARLLVANAEREVGRATSKEETRRLQHIVKHARRVERLSKYYDAARELARRLTEWDLARTKNVQQYFVSTGGGPGIMEAANRGAADVPNGKSIGLGISLPFESGVNPWVTEGLDFEFHYFFTRKYWFLYLCKAMAIFPGGFGTMDELFEALTLRQTGKIKKPIPTVLFGSDYFNDILNIQAMVDWGTISEKDLILYHVTDSVDDAFSYIVEALVANEALAAAKPRKTIETVAEPIGSLESEGPTRED